MNKRNYFITSEFKIALFFVVIALTLFIALWGLLPLIWITDGNILIAEIEARRSQIFIAGILLYSICMFWVSYRWAEEKQARILNRINILCGSIAEGDRNLKLHFRKKDPFDFFAETFNTFIKTNNDKRIGTLKQLDLLKATIEEKRDQLTEQEIREWQKILGEGNFSSN